ncbi:hypothetical protein BDZ89DRAFT_1084978 [Hymenopellis radicata]|nr:hypothetical protein BDZ89DRAFT_1084978 [Hymenopellis radicata]
MVWWWWWCALWVIISRRWLHRRTHRITASTCRPPHPSSAPSIVCPIRCPSIRVVGPSLSSPDPVVVVVVQNRRRC